MSVKSLLMNIKILTLPFLLLAFVVLQLEAQDPIYLDAKGAVKQTEEKSVLKIETESVDNKTLVYKSSWDKQKWESLNSFLLLKKSQIIHFMFSEKACQKRISLLGKLLIL